jgi:hypothetical protein
MPFFGWFNVTEGDFKLMNGFGSALRIFINESKPDASAAASLHVGGTLTLGRVLVLTTGGSMTFAQGQGFNLFDWLASTGSFSSFDFSAARLPAGLAWDTSELYTAGVLEVSAVPEPGTWAMWLAGVACMGGLTRRRRA